MDFADLFKAEPEVWNGLHIYPVLMKDYPMFLAVKDCITTSQQSWPYPWSTIRYLEGLIGMGMLPRLIILLRIVFRLEEAQFPIFPNMEGDKLAALAVIQGDLRGVITPKNFGELRELIARQNGLELPDETLNQEVLQAQSDLSSAGSTHLKVDLQELIYSVSLNAGTTPEKIMDWTVRRFQATERALDRRIGHLIASVTLATGGKFKNGSPYPSWKFDREDPTSAIEPLSALSGRLAGSVQQK